MSKDQKYQNGKALWAKAKTIIPGGNQLLSKRSERFLPGLWPAYYSKAKGCEVWDLEGNHYFDFAQMGVGSCILGYADEDVNRSVKYAIDQGSMCTLNSYEEIELAERLIALHPWSEMVRFARTGGEACAIAIRIARAATGKSKVVFCGYHGWHDWYLSANIDSNTSLDDQLLPGLKPHGIPTELCGTAIPFKYNDLSELDRVATTHGDDIAAIIMEPRRDKPPLEGFLEDVRKVADRINAVLIFDEITSGFRKNLGGIHLTYGVLPDMAIFGKALGNGYPISAVIGRRDIMEYAQECFISSTFWTERVGFVAALATLKKMETHKVQEKLVNFGRKINAGWRTLAEKHRLKIDIRGIPPLTHLSFVYQNPLEIQTLYAQEMLERGYLLGSSVYTTYAYTDEVIDKFVEDSSFAFRRIRDALESEDVKAFLKDEVIHPGFKRLN
jgi:glutamate-1-semialdehyde 2,1-aminomutase